MSSENAAFGEYSQPATTAPAMHYMPPAVQTQTAEHRTAAPAATGLSLLDELAAEAKKELGRKVRYDIANRPGWSAEFETNIDSDDFNRYRRSAQGKKKRAEDMDPTIFGGMALVEYNTAIYMKGVQVETADGEALTFRDKQFMGMFPDAFTQVDALVKFIGSGHVIAMGNALYAEAGYGDEVAPLDPTDA